MNGSSWNALNITNMEYSNVYLHDGEATYTDHETGQQYPVVPGSVFRRYPGRTSSLHYASERVVGCFVTLPGSAWQLLRDCQSASVTQPVLQIGVDEQIMHRCAAMVQRLRNASDSHLGQVAQEMLHYVVDVELLALDKAEDHGFMARACALLDRDLGERVSMPQIAAEMKLSYGYFRERFRQLAGNSPGDYRLRRRIERAQVMLCEPETSIKQVAHTLGYPDVPSFARQFRRIAQVPPGEFQRVHRGYSK